MKVLLKGKASILPPGNADASKVEKNLKNLTSQHSSNLRKELQLSFQDICVYIYALVFTPAGAK